MRVRIPKSLLVLLGISLLIVLLDYRSGLITDWVSTHRPPMSWEKFIEFTPYIFKGAVVTVQITVLGYALAVVVGLIIALARMSKIWWLSIPFTIFMEFIRNTPLLVQLYFAFWVLPNFGILLPAFGTGVVALGIHFGAYLAECYRAGLEAVPRGQYEAATSLNMPPMLSMRHIILPQAVRTVIPTMGNYLIGMFKATVFVSAIAVQEVMFNAYYLGSSTFRVFELYTLAALFYFAMSFPAARLVNALERHMNKDY